MFLTTCLHADLETPVSAYLKLRGDAPCSFLLESVEGPETWASHSIIGIGARRVLSHDGQTLTDRGPAGVAENHTADPLTALRDAIATPPREIPPDLPPFVGAAFGFLSYDAVRAFEPIGAKLSTPDVPYAYFFEPEVVAVFDNRHHTLTLYATDPAQLADARTRLSHPLPAHRASLPWREPESLDDPAQFEASVRRAKEHIRAGDVIQVVLSRRFALPRTGDPFDVYRGLRTINPSPYLFYFDTPDLCLAGASPEVMIRVQDRRAVVRPIAGTRPRGRDPDEDRRLAQELLADPKERAEHIMLVDLGRNDVGRVSAPGAVEVSELMTIERYSHVMHIVSEVQGTLRPDQDAFDALRAAFPAGTLSGAPKVRAMQIIEALESHPRGIYGGAIGYFAPNGDADFGIAIRTLVAKPETMIVQAGAGIVADSDPQREREETEHKAQAVLRAARWATTERAAW